ncbi:hypothetical protein AB1Y20_017401 [Prymnesium parvum]|uniref:rRNA biogenesis protein RRP36 n=1 Tax=Prymnesium parvum TaxID=97485 RepID=A0AB34JKC9_PRYPA
MAWTAPHSSGERVAGGEAQTRGQGVKRSATDTRPDREGVKQRKVVPKRENKNQPRILSSKRPVGCFRVAPGLKAEAGASNAANLRDPRFDPMSAGAKLNEQSWRKAYSFLFEQQAQRIQEIQEQLRVSGKAAKSKSCKSGGGAKKRRAKARIIAPEAEEQLRAELTKLLNQQKLDQQKQREQEVLRAMRKEEVAAVKEGKGVFFPKKSAIREQLLRAKYDDLKKSGKLDKFLAKRRQRLANKQHKRLPGRRDDGNTDAADGEW